MQQCLREAGGSHHFYLDSHSSLIEPLTPLQGNGLTQSSSAHPRTPWVLSFHLQRNAGNEHFPHFMILRPHRVCPTAVVLVDPHLACQVQFSEMADPVESAESTVKQVAGGPETSEGSRDVL